MWYMVHINNYGASDGTQSMVLVNYDEQRCITVDTQTVKGMIKSGEHIVNIQYKHGALNCAVGSFMDYIDKGITVLKAIYDKNKLVGYAISDWNGNIANLPLSKVTSLAKRLHLTNGTFVQTVKSRYIRSRGKSFEKIKVEDINYTRDEIEEAKHCLHTELLM